MTPEELKAELEKVKNENAKKLADLESENLKLKTDSGKVDTEKILLDNANLKKLVSDLESQNKTLKDDNKTFSLELDESKSMNKNHIINGSISKAFSEIGIDDKLLNGATALIKNENIVLSEKNEPMIGDKPLIDYVKSWGESESGKPFLKHNHNGGSGASGSGSQNAKIEDSKYFDSKSEHYNLTKQGEIFKQNPELYKQLKGF